ncbi:hypothetical protein BDP27DRAFT_1214645 [Rhodocollybia butyracea]|uniref:Elongator complex protein 6 n=1 Tax=Rhodocollybia butyracea TaxID=206335 RepID=A0A9P5Q440_9AGAR|nr:hypothetical protein BDP27DRAFT_1214645 [Rhodocollybia butyracea]
MLSPFDLPDGIFLLITDELPSPADFALHQCLISHAKEKKDSLRIVLSVSQSLTKWQSISGKSSVTISQQITAKTFHLIDVSSGLESDKITSDPLHALYEQVAAVLETYSQGPDALVILDDISALEWIGYSTSGLFRLCRALRALCLKNNATLLVRHHIVTPGNLDRLFRDVYSLCTHHLDIQPLTSGRSGAVSGQIALHLGPNASSVQPAIKVRSRSTALQYRLTDGSALFFERGSSRGVL